MYSCLLLNAPPTHCSRLVSAGAKPRRKAPALKPASKVINIIPSSKGFEDSKRRRKVTKR